MNTDVNFKGQYDNKPVQELHFDGNQRSVFASEKTFLVLKTEYMGDRDEAWIIERDGPRGNEVARHNVRHIRTIVWAT